MEKEEMKFVLPKLFWAETEGIPVMGSMFSFNDEEKLQILFIIWRKIHDEREKFRKGSPKFDELDTFMGKVVSLIESILSRIRIEEKPKENLSRFYLANIGEFNKFSNNWVVRERPTDPEFFYDEHSTILFMCIYKGVVYMGLNPENYIITYKNS